MHAVGATNNPEPLILLAYVSKIRFELIHDPVQLNAMTTTILGQASDYNKTHQLTGVLYTDGQYFFQCLEGPHSTVTALYQKIKQDSRHEVTSQLVTHPITDRNFESWTMKFVDNHQQVTDFFQQHGLSHFSPQMLSQTQLKEFIDKLSQLS